MVLLRRPRTRAPAEERERGERRPPPDRPVRSVSNRGLVAALRPDRAGPEGGSGLDAAVARAIQQRRGRGGRLPATFRADAERALAAPFDHVRVHTDSHARVLTQRLGATAFTVGGDIFFGSGTYQPSSRSGRELLAHELTHTVQQGPAPGTPQRVSTAGEAAEREAAAIGRAFATAPRQGSVPPARTDAIPEAAAPLPTSAARFPMAALARTSTLVQRREVDEPEVADPAMEAARRLGERLLREHPTGVAVAFYDASPGEREIRERAAEWAARENAASLPDLSATVADVVFGAAMPDSLALTGALPALAALLRQGVAAALAPFVDTLSSVLASVIPGQTVTDDVLRALVDTSPAARVRAVALFSHGTTGWMSLGDPDLTRRRVEGVAQAIAPTLLPNAKVIFFACSTARTEGAAADWIGGTMDPGGADSLAADMRDHLLAAGVDEVEVWGHTTVGHTSRNTAKRVFLGSDGAGAEGRSFAATWVFPPPHAEDTVDELVEHLRADGYGLDDPIEQRVRTAAAAEVRMAQYTCWTEAAMNRGGDAALRHDGANLAEAAPLHPDAVGAIVRTHWAETFWEEHRRRGRAAVLRRLVRSQRLRR